MVGHTSHSKIRRVERSTVATHLIGACPVQLSKFGKSSEHRHGTYRDGMASNYIDLYVLN
jgi:hypothetical protein